MRLTSLKIDAARAERGDWVSGIPSMGDLRVKVRGFGNTDYQAAIAREQSKVSREDRLDGRAGGRIKPAVLDAIMSRCMAEAILIDWDGLTDDEGAPITYSRERAAAFLTDPNLLPFRDAVAWAANAVNEVEVDRVEGAVGNSASA